MRVTIAPESERLFSFEYDGPLSLKLRSEHFPQSLSESARWRVTMAQDEEMPWSLEGGFVLGGDVHTDDVGMVVGELTAQIAPICAEDNATEDTDCLPCNLEQGCTFSMEIGFCDSALGETRIPFWVGVVRESGEPFYNECKPDSDHMPCERLDEWILVEIVGDSASFCDGNIMDSESADMP